MPIFRCPNCGQNNLVPPNASYYTCTHCGIEQDTPPLNEQVEENTLRDAFLEKPKDEKPNMESLFNRFASFEENTVYHEEEKMREIQHDETTLKNAIYYTALSKIGGEDIDLYYEAIAKLEKIRGWKDADALIEECRQKIEELKDREEQSERKSEKKAKRTKTALFVSIPSVLIIAAVILAGVFYVIPNRKYQQALTYEKQGNVIAAFEIFDSLNFKDSSTRANALFEEYKTQMLKTAKPGDIIYFGNYEQDGKTTEPESIPWIVLDKKDGAYFLMSYYGIDCYPYHTENEPVTWENCASRKWLNSDFYQAAFNDDERKKILSTTVTADKNPDYDVDAGKDTVDKLFLLSIEEVKRYLTTPEQRRCFPTVYAHMNHVAVGKTKYNGSYAASWFTRTPGLDQTMVGYISGGGKLRSMGYSVNYLFIAVRPAMWIKAN